MKKIMVYSVILSMILTVTGCGGKAQETQTKESNPPAAVQEDSKTADFEALTVLGLALDNLTLDGTLVGKYEGEKITIATCEGDFATALENQAKTFEEITGAEVVVNTFPGESYMEKIQMDLNAGGSFDAILMPIANIHGYATTGLVADMTGMMSDWASESYDPDDFLTGLYDTYARYGNKIVALPYKPDVIMNFYRTDLFADQDLQAKFKEQYGYDLTAPNDATTLEQYLDICRFFTKKFNPDSPTTYGYCANAGAMNLRWIWQNRLCAYGGDIVNDSFEADFNNQAGVDAMNYMLQLAECAPENWEEFDWESSNAMFCSGDAAMMEQWPGMYNTAQTEGSAVKDKVGASVTAGGAPVLGGWALAISAKSANQELAFKFCEFCTSKDGEILKVENTMDPCRTSNYEKPEIAEYNPLYPVLLECLDKGASIADVDVPIVTSELNNVLELGCHYVLTKEKTPEDSLKWMADQFEETISDAGLK